MVIFVYIKSSMLNKYLFSILFVLSVFCTQAQTTINGSFVHGGITRTYSFYVPASYTPGTAVPMVIGLHGTSSDGASFAQYRDFRPIADTANFIMVHPDGSTMIGIRFWNYGNVFGSTVDDVGFLEALIDTISASYTINPQRIYAAGMSNGSFMSYCLACESDRFAAIGGVTGSMSVSMYNSCNPVRPTPTIHVHGTDDPTNPYAGTSTMVGIDQMSRFWVDQNSCDTTPAVINLPDINTTDGATATRYLYTGGTNGNTVELFKVTGGEHTWPGWPMPSSSDITCMDFDACIELWRFFSQYEIPAATSIKKHRDVELNVWPNPSEGLVNFQTAEHTICEVAVFDLQGREVERVTKEDIRSIDLRHLKEGMYIAKISGKGFYGVKKLNISH
jgi:polyhydroxybutyrate depolymerase